TDASPGQLTNSLALSLVSTRFASALTSGRSANGRHYSPVSWHAPTVSRELVWAHWPRLVHNEMHRSSHACSAHIDARIALCMRARRTLPCPMVPSHTRITASNGTQPYAVRSGAH
ncbi:hypothetical protein OG21DRAFT_1512212, partial [Imleria badia]